MVSMPLRVVPHELGGTGPLLLMLHANGFHGRVFLPMVPFLAPHFRCVGVDLPGHGDSPAADRPFSAEELLDSLRAFIHQQGVTGAYCLGHSLGGALAAWLQLQEPQTFRALFLFEPVIRPSATCSDTPPAAAAEGPAPGQGHGGPGRPAPQAASSGGCSPSPSLLRPPQGPSAAPPGAPSPAGPSPTPGQMLARMARRRQSWFPSLAAAQEALGAKPPFSAFHPEALHAYLACGGLRPAPPDQQPARTSPSAVAVAVAPEGTAAPSQEGEALATGSASTSGPSPGGGRGVVLSCSPESEARVFEALDPPPLRPWHLLTRPLPHTQPGPEAQLQQHAGHSEAAGAEGAGGVGAGLWPRLAVAVGAEAGLHARLARWGAELAGRVPGAQLFRFPQLHHLGPMEDPRAVAEAALGFFRQPQQQQPAERPAAAAAAAAEVPGPGAASVATSRL